jgi:endo-1,4-beta-D-glucanase Y
MPRPLRLLLLLTLTATLHAQSTWPLWGQYSARFISPEGRVIDRSPDNHTDRTTSEAQAYGMFFALVAGDRPTFDRMFTWTQNNLAQGDLSKHLPAWSWGHAANGQWIPLDPNPATDADLWLTFDLLEAGRLWNQPTYTTLARTLLQNITRLEVATIPCVGPTGGPMLLPAPAGFHPTPDIWILNPSYAPVPILQRFATEQPGGPWYTILASLPQLLGQTSVAGFSMDWAQCQPNHHWLAVPLPGTAQKESLPPSQPSSQPAAAYGSYDAIRVYLWAGIANPAMSYAKDDARAVPGMAFYLKKNPQLPPPLAIDSSGKIIWPESPIGFTAAVIPYLYALGFQAEAKLQSARLAAAQDPATGLYGKTSSYYDQNLALFSLAWSEHRYQFEKNGFLKLSSKPR